MARKSRQSQEIPGRRAVIAGIGGMFALGFGGASAQGQAALTFWSVRLNTPELQAALKGILAEFEKAHPNIKITNEPVSGGLVYPKFIAASRGQQMPDIAEAFSYHPLQFAAADQMEPMDDIIKEWEGNGYLADIVNEFAYRKFFWKEHYWGVPYNLDVRAIYYRKDILAAKGLSPPKNWADFEKAAIACHNAQPGMFGLAYPGGNFHIAQHYYMAFMFQAGGGILDEKGNLIFGTSAKDANVRALEFLTSFHTKHKITPPGIVSHNTDDTQTLFVQGRAAFAMGTGAVIGRVTRENAAMLDNVGILEVLEGPGGPQRKLTAGFFNPMFVWKHSPGKEAAKTFVRWFVQPGRLEPLYKAVPGQHWPIFKRDFNTARVQENRLLKEMLTNVVPYATDFAYPGLGRPEMGVIDGEKMFAVPVNEVLAGAKTPEKAVTDAHAAMAKLFV